MENYLINVEYRVRRDWFNDVRDIIYTNLHFCNHIFWYDIEFWYYDKETKEELWKIKLKSTVNKERIQLYLDLHSTRVENYKVL